MISFIFTSLVTQLLLWSGKNTLYEYANDDISIHLASMSDTSAYIHDADKVISICIGHSHAFANQNTSMHFPSNQACVFYDSASKQIDMCGDIAGVIPIWYSVTSTHFIVTTDLLTAVSMGFRYVTPLGPGMHVTLDVTSREIVQLRHWQDVHRAQGDYNASALFNVAKKSCQKYDFANTELDVTDASSLLLECIVSSSLSTRYRYKTVPLIIDVPKPASMPDDVYNLVRLLNDNEPSSIAWTPSLYRIALDRWQICAEASQLPGKSFSAFDTGISARPWHVYFQNYFCSMLGVRVEYPLAMIEIQTMIWSARHASSELWRTVDNIIGAGVCGDMPSDRARKITIDFAKDSNFPLRYFEMLTSSSVSGNVMWDKLYTKVKSHASSDGDIVLLLATSSYIDLLKNFVCYVKAMSDLPSQNMFIVLSPNEDVIKLAEDADFGALIIDFDNVEWLPSELKNKHSWSNNVTDSDFGTIRYQQLVYFRTLVAQKIIEYGYNTLIADIDTAWLQNPFASIYDGANDDVVVTYDDSEICGCFVYLNATDRTRQFWTDVTSSHLSIIANYLDENLDRLADFFDSEQKILTRLILNETYTSSLKLKVSALPEIDFPSGVTYFSKPITATPVVVHNNYIIGSDMKIMRFRMYGLWRESRNDNGKIMCEDPRNQWKIFDSMVYAPHPSLTAILPIHNSIHNTTYVKFMLLTDKINAASTIWVANDPPSSMNFYPLFVGEFNLTDPGVHTFSSTIQDSNIFVTMDIGLYVTSFSYDRKNLFHELANDAVPSVWASNDVQLILPPATPVTDTDEKRCDIDGSYAFSLNIITFARPWSLRRLLDSLLEVDYGGCTVDMNIRIDSVVGSKYDDLNRAEERNEVLLLQQESVEIANNFPWPFGHKQVYVFDRNIGLMQQWYLAFEPKHEHDIGFILEDDLEVSPLFFLWTLNALRTYYTPEQRQAHIDLLQVVRSHVAINGSRPILDSGETYAWTYLEQYANLHAGDPVMYGICTSKCILDPSHYPTVFEARNNRQPFLQSWGPMLFPLAWQAFREWWLWSAAYARDTDVFGPLTENLVINYFYKENNRIWTPWIARFAYETGAKCLYTNFPGNFSLTTNHREMGENYGYTKGPVTETVQPRHITNGLICVDRDCSSFWLYPSYKELSRWQYDLNSRRAGSKVFNKLRWTPSDSQSCLQPAIIEIVEMYSLPNFIFMHVGKSDMLLHLLNRYDTSQHIIIDSPCTPAANTRCITSSILMSHLRADIAVIYLDTLLQRTIQYLSPQHIERVLVIGSCFSAPTDFTWNRVTFTLVDQACLEHGQDIGGSIYVQRDMLPQIWEGDRTSIIRRIDCGVVTRRMKLHQYATRFPA